MLWCLNRFIASLCGAFLFFLLCPGLLSVTNLVLKWYQKNVQPLLDMLSSCVSNQIRSTVGVSDVLIRFTNPVAATVSAEDWVSPSKFPPKVLHYLLLKYSWLSRQQLQPLHLSWWNGQRFSLLLCFSFRPVESNQPSPLSCHIFKVSYQ